MKKTSVLYSTVRQKVDDDKEQKNKEENSKTNKIVVGDLELDLEKVEVKVKGQVKALTPKEFEILSYLIKNKNTAISRAQLLSKLWGYDFFGDDRTIDTHIKLLRNNLEKYRNLIETVRGIGYKFNDEK